MSETVPTITLKVLDIVRETDDACSIAFEAPR